MKAVPKPQIKQINLSINSKEIKKGETEKLKVEILPKEAEKNGITFTSSNSSIAKVDSEGNITGINPGKAVITVKSRENNVSSNIEVQIYSTVENMELNVQNLMLQVGDKFTVLPRISPSNASNQKVKYSSQNEEIIRISEEGIIDAVSVGKTKVMAITVDGNIQKEIEIVVKRKLEKEELEFDKQLKVTANEIAGWSDVPVKVKNAKDMIKTNYEIQVYNFKNELLNDNNLIGTGSTIKIIKDDDVLMEYKVIIYGDVNGDGKINTVDLLVLQRHILEINGLKDLFYEAGNINRNNKSPSTIDLLIIQRHILEYQFIEQ